MSEWYYIWEGVQAFWGLLLNVLLLCSFYLFFYSSNGEQHIVQRTSGGTAWDSWVTFNITHTKRSRLSAFSICAFMVNVCLQQSHCMCEAAAPRVQVPHSVQVKVLGFKQNSSSLKPRDLPKVLSSSQNLGRAIEPVLDLTRSKIKKTEQSSKKQWFQMTDAWFKKMQYTYTREY